VKDRAAGPKSTIYGDDVLPSTDRWPITCSILAGVADGLNKKAVANKHRSRQIHRLGSFRALAATTIVPCGCRPLLVVRLA
jgi:hypothetical protein